jgi:hypothetical protein
MQVMETRKKKLGTDHPHTLTSMNNLAFTLKGQGRHMEAIKLMQDCVQLSKRTLGANHPHSLHFARTLAQWQEQVGVGVAL